jgi:hypothetical protein
MAKALPEVKFFFKFETFHVGFADAVYVKSNGKNPYTHSTGDYVMIFNNYMSNAKFVGCPDADTNKMVRSIREKYPHLSDEEYSALLCIGTFHYNGYFRENCLRKLADGR